MESASEHRTFEQRLDRWQLSKRSDKFWIHMCITYVLMVALVVFGIWMRGSLITASRERALANCRAINQSRAAVVTLAQLDAVQRPSPVPSDPAVTQAWVEVNKFWSNAAAQTEAALPALNCPKVISSHALGLP